MPKRSANTPFPQDKWSEVMANRVDERGNEQNGNARQREAHIGQTYEEDSRMSGQAVIAASAARRAKWSALAVMLQKRNIKAGARIARAT